MAEKTVELDGRQIKLGALPLAGLRALRALNKKGDADDLDVMVETMYYCALRGGEEVPREFFEMAIDIANMQALSAVLAEVNAIEGAPPGEA
jgi:hypothetical protein